MEWDEAGFDEEAPRPLLPADDRLWRHPTELDALAPQARPSNSGGPPRMVTVVALTSCISVLLTLGVVAVIRPFGAGSAERSPATRSEARFASLTDAAAVTARLRPAIAKIRAISAGGGEKWGSGVIFRTDGMMLTTSHTVEGATRLEVVLDDGRQVGARLVGADRDTDVAVVDLEGGKFPTAELAPGRRTMKLGQPAMTIGVHPGPDSSEPVVRVTMVSAMGQEARTDDRTYVDMIRMDAAVAPGCEGGAMVDGSGKVVAIASANISDGMEAVGYATPIDVAKAVASQLLETGKVRRSWIGIEGATGGHGVVVGNVLPDSPAAAAGVVAGDVIKAIDGSEVTSMTALVVQLRALKPGTTTTVVVERGGERKKMPIELGERPD